MQKGYSFYLSQEKKKNTKWNEKQSLAHVKTQHVNKQC